MTITEKIAQLKSQVKSLKQGTAIKIAAQDTHVMMAIRIFQDGRNANGGDIGSYDANNSLYVNPKNSPKNFPPMGKPKGKGKGQTKFADGSPHKTKYFTSYADFRKTIGRKVDKVNLVLSGELQSDFGKAVIKINSLTYASTVRANNEKKIEGAEGRYGDIFKLSDLEKENFKETLKFETIRLFNA